jgi:hypothetical protein
LAARHRPGEALGRWLKRYAEFIATKRGLAAALHSGDPACNVLPDYFRERLQPALAALLNSATASGEMRTDIAAEDLLTAVGSLCMSTHSPGPAHARKMVALVVDGFRYGAGKPDVASKPG